MAREWHVAAYMARNAIDVGHEVRGRYQLGKLKFCH